MDSCFWRGELHGIVVVARRSGTGTAFIEHGACGGASRFVTDPYPSTYQAHPDAPVLIQNATVLTGTGQRLDNADVLLRDGRIVAVGASCRPMPLSPALMHRASGSLRA